MVRTRLSMHRAATAVAAVSITGAGIFAALPAAGASAAVGQSCGYGRTHGNVGTCVTVNGTMARASVHVRDAGRVLDICLSHNRHHIGCTGFRYIPAGRGEAFAVSESGHEIPDGRYTARTYRLNADGDSTRIAQQYIDWRQ